MFYGLRVQVQHEILEIIIKLIRSWMMNVHEQAVLVGFGRTIGSVQNYMKKSLELTFLSLLVSIL